MDSCLCVQRGKVGMGVGGGGCRGVCQVMIYSLSWAKIVKIAKNIEST